MWASPAVLQMMAQHQAGPESRRLAGLRRHLSESASGSRPSPPPRAAPPAASELRAGVIGLDGPHPAGVAIAKLLIGADGSEPVTGCRVVAAYDRGVYPRPSSVHSSVPHGMHGTIFSCIEPVPRNTREMAALGVPIVESIAELLGMVDVVFLMTRDGRPRLEQAAEVLRARKPLFMDRPVAANLADALTIFTLAAGLGVPCCSASPLRWAPGGWLAGADATALAAELSGPAEVDADYSDAGHLELCWGAVHGIEMLYAAMGGGGCASVAMSRDASDRALYEGTWPRPQPGQPRNVRRGTYCRDAQHVGYSGDVELTAGGRLSGGARPLCAEGTGGKRGNEAAEVTPEDCRAAMLQDVVRWFRSGGKATPPVSPAETLEVYAFIAAAEESKKRGAARGGDGAAVVTLEDVLVPARRAAQVVLDREWYTPGTARALGDRRGRLGSPPCLALVTDAEAAEITGAAIMGHDAMGERAVSEAATNIPEEYMWFGKNAEGWAEKKSSLYKPAPEAAVEGKGQEEQEVVEAAEEVVEEDY